MPALEGVAFVFPGQGSQEIGMGRDLFEADAGARARFAEADQILGYALSRIILEGPESELRMTEHAQPAIFLISIVLYERLGLRPAALAGHSLGEYSALVAAGALDFASALTLLRQRGTLMQAAVPPGAGLMLALIGVDADQVRGALEECEGAVDIANLNAPGQVVIAGAKHAVRRAAQQIAARQNIELSVSAPFHCRLMRPAEDGLAAPLDACRIAAPRIVFYNNVDARQVHSAAEVRDGLQRQVSRTVRWSELVTNMIREHHIHTVVEVGPGAVLSGLMRRIDRNIRRLSVHDRASIDAARAELNGA